MSVVPIVELEPCKKSYLCFNSSNSFEHNGSFSSSSPVSKSIDPASVSEMDTVPNSSLDNTMSSDKAPEKAQEPEASTAVSKPIDPATAIESLDNGPSATTLESTAPSAAKTSPVVAEKEQEPETSTAASKLIDPATVTESLDTAPNVASLDSTMSYEKGAREPEDSTAVSRSIDPGTVTESLDTAPNVASLDNTLSYEKAAGEPEDPRVVSKSFGPGTITESLRTAPKSVDTTSSTSTSSSIVAENAQEPETFHSTKSETTKLTKPSKGAANKAQNAEHTTGRRSSRRSAPSKRLPLRFRQMFFGNKSTARAVPRNFEQVSFNPPVYAIHNFMTESELQHLEQIKSSHGEKFSSSRSYTQSDDGSKVVSDHRTSTFVHLKKFGDAKVRTIEHRAADVVGLPVENVEPLQIVRYKNGQHFGLHHDCGELLDNGEVVGPCNPVRLCTFFVYLNTVEEGGGGCTAFPTLGNLKVRPVRGSAVLFCNVLESGELDPRVIHAAEPTMPGVAKLGMNIWISSASMLLYSLTNTGLVLPQNAKKADKQSALQKKTTKAAGKTHQGDQFRQGEVEKVRREKATEKKKRKHIELEEKTKAERARIREKEKEKQLVADRKVPILRDIMFMFKGTNPRFVVKYGHGLNYDMYHIHGLEFKNRKPMGRKGVDYWDSKEELLDYVCSRSDLVQELETETQRKYLLPGHDVPLLCPNEVKADGGVGRKRQFKSREYFDPTPIKRNKNDIN